MNHGKNILITGASGLLGRSLMVRLKDLATVTGVGYSNRAESLVPVDLRDADALHTLLNEAKPDAVVHLLKLEERGIYHYSSLEGGTKHQWARELADLAGLSMDHVFRDRKGAPTRAVRPRDTQLAVEKIRQTGLNRFTPFREVAESVLQFFA